MRKATQRAILARLAAALVMASLALALIGLTVTLGPLRLAGSRHVVVQLVLPIAATAMVLIAVLSTTARAAWGRLCLANGVVAIALAAASLQTRGQPIGAADPIYEHALDQSIQWWLRHLLWSATAYSGAAIILGLVFFVLSYWLLHWPFGRRRAAH